MSDRNYRMKPLPIHHIWLVRWPNRLWTPQTGVNLFNNCMYYQFGIWFSILIESLTRLSVSYSITTVVQKFSLYFAGSWMNTRHFPPPSFHPDLGCPECHHGRISSWLEVLTTIHTQEGIPHAVPRFRAVIWRHSSPSVPMTCLVPHFLQCLPRTLLLN